VRRDVIRVAVMATGSYDVRRDVIRVAVMATGSYDVRRDVIRGGGRGDRFV
jgi:hypothetical protein